MIDLRGIEQDTVVTLSTVSLSDYPERKIPLLLPTEKEFSSILEFNRFRC